ncbi:MAG: hypothetical protein ACRCSO_06985 [Sphingomonas sp.]
MADKSNGRGGGVLIALGAMIGPVIGLYTGQPSIGLLAGVAIGAALAAVIWLRATAGAGGATIPGSARQ